MVRPLAPPADAAGMGGAPATTRSQTDARRMRSTGALLALIGRVQARGERAGVDSDTFFLRSREVALVIFLSDCPFTLNCKTFCAALQGARKGLECCPALARPAAPLPKAEGGTVPGQGTRGGSGRRCDREGCQSRRVAGRSGHGATPLAAAGGQPRGERGSAFGPGAQAGARGAGLPPLVRGSLSLKRVLCFVSRSPTR